MCRKVHIKNDLLYAQKSHIKKKGFIYFDNVV